MLKFRRNSHKLCDNWSQNLKQLWQSKRYHSKTAGYHQNTLRLPILMKMPFYKMKAFFFHQNAPFLHHIFNYFQLQKISDFSPKTSQLRWRRLFLTNNTISLVIYKKFATFSDFEKFEVSFWKNLFFYRKKNKFRLLVLKNLTISVTFYGKFATIWWKKFHVQKRDQN